MNLLQIQYFVSVANNMSFTLASRELYISQPSISKQVAALEDELGIKLFNRSGKSLELTSAGRILYNDCKNLLANVSDIVQRARDIGNAVSGRLRVGVMRYMDISRITKGAVEAFHNENPSIVFEFRTLLGEDLKQEFIDGKLDCLFMLNYKALELSGTVPTSTLNIFNMPIRMVYPTSYNTPDGPPNLHSFVDKAFVIVAETEKNLAMNQTALQHVTNAGIVPKEIIWADSIDSLLHYVEAGFGIGLVGPTARIPRDKYITYVPLTGESARSGVTMCWDPENRNPHLISFIETVKSKCCKD